MPFGRGKKREQETFVDVLKEAAIMREKREKEKRVGERGGFERHIQCDQYFFSNVS